MTRCRKGFFAVDKDFYPTITIFSLFNRSLLVHGFAVDEEGKKMSKSQGNVIDPDIVISGGKVRKTSCLLFCTRTFIITCLCIIQSVTFYTIQSTCRTNEL